MGNMKSPSMRGGGGQRGRRGKRSFPPCPCIWFIIPDEAAAVDESGDSTILSNDLPATGLLVGHANNRGTRGDTLDLRGRREMMSARGMRGRLMKLCQGQLEGSSVRRCSNILVLHRGGGEEFAEWGVRDGKSLEIGIGIGKKEGTHSSPRNSLSAYAP
jgi:hypothetical protein